MRVTDHTQLKRGRVYMAASDPRSKMYFMARRKGTLYFKGYNKEEFRYYYTFEEFKEGAERSVIIEAPNTCFDRELEEILK